MSLTSLFPASSTHHTPVSIINLRSRINTLLPTRTLLHSDYFPRSSSLVGIFKCSSEEKANSWKSSIPKTKDLLAGLVDERVGELLNREENRGLFDGLERATQRVILARKELLEIQKQEREAITMRDYVRKLQSREAEVAECEKDLLGARSLLEEAENGLAANMVQSKFVEELENYSEREEIDKDVERMESVKAAIVAAVVGTLSSMPISFTEGLDGVHFILHSAAVFISCALFGVTFRYAVRRDLDNVHLKTGTSAAFGIVQGLAQLIAVYPFELKNEILVSTATKGVIYMSQNLLVFFFAGIGTDYCFKMGFLSAFPVKKVVSHK